MRFLSKRSQSYFFMLVNTVLWSLPFLVVKPALSVTTPYRFLLYRYCLAIICSLPILVFYLHLKHQKLSLKDVLTITIIEAIGSVAALALVYSGLKYVGAIETGFMSASSPLLITLGGVWFLKEREEKHEFIGLIFGFIGTFLLVFNPALSFGQAVAQVSLVGFGLILASNILNMFYFPLMKKHYQHLPKLLVAAVGFYVAALGFLALSWWEAGSWATLISTVSFEIHAPSVQLASIYMAVFGSIIGLTAYIKGQDGIEASEASLFVYLQPLIYVPIGIIWLKESISPVQIMALIIISIGVYLATIRPVHRRHQAKSKALRSPGQKSTAPKAKAMI